MAPRRPLWTGQGSEGEGSTIHPYDLYHFKNGRNFSVAEYLNIESAWSPLLRRNPRAKKSTFPSGDWIHGAPTTTETMLASGVRWTTHAKEDFPWTELTRPGSASSILTPKEEQLRSAAPIIASPSHSRPVTSHSLPLGSQLNILDTTKIDMNQLMDLMESEKMWLLVFGSWFSVMYHAYRVFALFH